METKQRPAVTATAAIEETRAARPPYWRTLPAERYRTTSGRRHHREMLPTPTWDERTC
jgi:hypothetical protein